MNPIKKIRYVAHLRFGHWTLNVRYSRFCLQTTWNRKANAEKTLDKILSFFTFSENNTQNTARKFKVRVTKCWRKEKKIEWLQKYVQNVRHANKNRNKKMCKNFCQRAATILARQINGVALLLVCIFIDNFNECSCVWILMRIILSVVRLFFSSYSTLSAPYPQHDSVGFLSYFLQPISYQYFGQ